MGIGSFFRKLFGGEDADEKILNEARARHGIVLTAQDKKEMDQAVTEDEQRAADYNVWEDLRNFRSNFFLGSWATRKFHIVGEDKVKKDLEALAKKREEKAKKAEWEKWK